MKVKVIIAALLLAGAGMSANAQSTDDNWFLQGQLGASYSLDGTGISKLISPAGQIAAGKYFNPYVGARLAVSGWTKSLQMFTLGMFFPKFFVCPYFMKNELTGVFPIFIQMVTDSSFFLTGLFDEVETGFF